MGWEVSGGLGGTGGLAGSAGGLGIRGASRIHMRVGGV